MQYFNFTRLLRKYERSFKLITVEESTYNSRGDLVVGDSTETDMKGAIISLSESKIRRSEGTLTTNDRQLYLTQPITKSLEGAKVVYNDRVYSVEQETENAEFTGVYAYLLKYVSAFGEVTQNGE